MVTLRLFIVSLLWSFPCYAVKFGLEELPVSNDTNSRIAYTNLLPTIALHSQKAVLINAPADKEDQIISIIETNTKQWGGRRGVDYLIMNEEQALDVMRKRIIHKAHEGLFYVISVANPEELNTLVDVLNNEEDVNLVTKGSAQDVEEGKKETALLIKYDKKGTVNDNSRAHYAKWILRGMVLGLASCIFGGTIGVIIAIFN